jgi:hypothetical protein
MKSGMQTFLASYALKSKVLVLDAGFRIQEVKKASDPDPQHWLKHNLTDGDNP